MPIATEVVLLDLTECINRPHETLLNHPDARTPAGIIVSLGLILKILSLLKRALASTGIQAGHMKLQAKSLALLAGANPEEMPHVLSELLKAKHMNQETAQAILKNSEITKKNTVAV